MASEKRMRREATELIGDNLEADLVPVSFSHKDGGARMLPLPMFLACGVFNQALLGKKSYLLITRSLFHSMFRSAFSATDCSTNIRKFPSTCLMSSINLCLSSLLQVWS